jgi:hypothetical protein
VSRVLAARGTIRSAPALASDIEHFAGPNGDGAGENRTNGSQRKPSENGKTGDDQ